MGKVKLKITFTKESVEDFLEAKHKFKFEDDDPKLVDNLLKELEYVYTSEYNLCSEANKEFSLALEGMKSRKLDDSLETDLNKIAKELENRFFRDQDGESMLRNNIGIKIKI
jgi:hypothetical protein